MSSAADQSIANGFDEAILRERAKRRSYFCPGAGFALLGQDQLAIATFLTAIAPVALAFGFIFAPGLATAVALLASLVPALGFWIAEQLAVKKLAVQAPRPAFLVRGVVLTSIVAWTLGIVCAVLLVLRFSAFQMNGTGMSPGLSHGERLLYEKRVEPAKLRRGAVVAYRISDKSAWGEPGWFVIARILAIPGDRLSVRGGQYLVNGEPASPVAKTGEFKPALVVPSEPDTLTVPADSYFVVQDSPAGGYDSQVLSWALSQDLVSTELYYLSFDRGLMQPVE